MDFSLSLVANGLADFFDIAKKAPGKVDSETSRLEEMVRESAPGRQIGAAADALLTPAQLLLGAKGQEQKPTEEMSDAERFLEQWKQEGRQSSSMDFSGSGEAPSYQVAPATAAGIQRPDRNPIRMQQNRPSPLGFLNDDEDMSFGFRI